MSSKLKNIYTDLGISPSFVSSCKMPKQEECLSLVKVPNDVFGREAYLEVSTALAWQQLQTAAKKDGITLQLVSAYRSYDYQKQIFQRKLGQGESLESILQVNAAPGYSEHHSGRALDIGCPEYPHLEEEFEQSPAFAWLHQNANNFSFRLSFPRNNEFAVLYEPWHWYFFGNA